MDSCYRKLLKPISACFPRLNFPKGHDALGRSMESKRADKGAPERLIWIHAFATLETALLVKYMKMDLFIFIYIYFSEMNIRISKRRRYERGRCEAKANQRKEKERDRKRRNKISKFQYLSLLIYYHKNNEILNHR